MNVKAALLCGGTGSRLRPLTYYFQKTMLPIGTSQKPILEYIVRYLKFHGIDEITMLVGYKAEQIVNYFRDGSNFSVKVDYSYDNDELKGNGGALINAYRAGKFDGYEDILVYYSDILADMDLTDFLKFHKEKKFSATLAVSDHYKLPVGVAEMNGDTVVSFKEKPSININPTIGILMIKTEAIKKFSQMKGEIDIMGDIISSLVKEKSVGGYVTNSFWIDVGTTETYEKLDHELIETMFSKYFH
ncbi:MAG: nucleotidyltransferase family protein [Nitrososphaeria archaeon]